MSCETAIPELVYLFVIIVLFVAGMVGWCRW